MREWITTEYEKKNGRKPRGTKVWAFIPADGIWPNKMPVDAIAWIWGSYSDAKREVAMQYPEIDTWVVL